MSNQSQAIQGLPELVLVLKELPLRIEQQILKTAFRKAAKVAIAAIRAHIHHDDTGTLRKGITAKVATGTGTGIIKIRVGTRVVGKQKINSRGGVGSNAYGPSQPGQEVIDAWYGRLVESGHGPKALGKTLRRVLNAFNHEFGDQRTPPYPFMRPGFESSWEECLQVFVDAFQAQLDSVNIRGGLEQEAAMYEELEALLEGDAD